MNIVETENLCKIYKKKYALDNLSLTMDSGKVYGLFGKNGAGKSTLIKILLGMTFQTSGMVNIFGKKPTTGNKKIGYMGENIALYPHLSASDHIKIAGLSSSIDLNKNQIDNILNEIGLNVGNKPTKQFSLGMKRRLQLAIAMLVREVDFIILDEPTNGIDMDGMVWLKNKMQELKKKETTILIASHSIKELDGIIDNYFVIDKGKLINEGVAKKYDCREVVDITVDLSNNILDKCIECLKSNNIEIVYQDNFIFKLKTDKSYNELIRLFYENKIFPNNVEINKKSLEDEIMGVMRR